MNKLAGFVKENTETEPIVELTAQGNISYLPGGFGTITPIMKTLAKRKKSWNIEVLEKEGKYHVSFENQIVLEVEKQDYPDFVKRILRGKSGVVNPENMTVDLTSYILEAAEDTVQSAYTDLAMKMNQSFKTDPMSTALADSDFFAKMFGALQFDKPESAMFGMDRNIAGAKPIRIQIQDVVKRLRSMYKDDLGSIQMVANAFVDKTPLNTFSIFDDYDNLYGVRIQSRYRGVKMIFENTVSMNWVPVQSLFIEDPYTLEQISQWKTVRVIKNVVFPKSKTFGYHILRDIRLEIDSADDETEETKEEEND